MAKAIVAPLGGPGVPETYTDPVTNLSYSCVAGSPNLHFTDIAPSDSFCKHVHLPLGQEHRLGLLGHDLLPRRRASPGTRWPDSSETPSTSCSTRPDAPARNAIAGCSDTTYCPTEGVTRDQMAKFLGNAFDLELYAP